jgi:hypothetical protein
MQAKETCARGSSPCWPLGKQAVALSKQPVLLLLLRQYRPRCQQDKPESIVLIALFVAAAAAQNELRESPAGVCRSGGDTLKGL